MDEIGFRQWLEENGCKKKVQSDCISRLKRVERELSVDLDKKYQENELQDILFALSNMGKNGEMEKYNNVNLPIGKYYMSTYSHAVKKYIRFKSK